MTDKHISHVDEDGFRYVSHEYSAKRNALGVAHWIKGMLAIVGLVSFVAVVSFTWGYFHG